jgi:hypothetical protein
MTPFWIVSTLIIYSQGFGSERNSLKPAILSRNSFITTCIVGITSFTENAEASYSAYAAREKDWDERNRKGGGFFEHAKTVHYYNGLYFFNSSIFLQK